jgi:hypothetical protein
MDITIFPYSLVRYAALQSNALDNWYLDSMEKLPSIHHLKEQICDKIFILVNQEKDDKARQKLIQLKRAIHNDRPLNTIIPEALTADIAQLTAALQQKKQQEEQYTTQLNDHRRSLQLLAKEQSLQKGILLSSPVLFEQMAHYINKDPADFKQKDYKIEFSLLRYITRMCCKTSPFSAFTYTGLMQLDAHQIPGTREVKSCLTRNNSLFRYLLSIIRQHPVLNEQLLITKNITTEKINGKLTFFVNYQNVEAFQQLPNTPLNELILQRSNNITLGELITSLMDEIEDASRKDLKDYLLKMAATGLLELTTDNATPFTGPLATFIHQLQCYQQAYVNENAVGRFKILREAEVFVNNLFQELQLAAGLPITTQEPVSENKLLETMQFAHYHFTGRQIFYEDCYTPEIAYLAPDPVTNIVKKTDALLDHLASLDTMKPEREKMKRFYLSHYPSHQRVKVIDFYRDYYYHFKKHEIIEHTEYAMPQLDTLITSQSSEISIPPHFFPASPAPVSQSRGMFVQLFNNNQCGVINAILPGMGKVNGRFLSLFGKEVSDCFLDYNNRLHPDIIKAELSDSSSFNANIHPPLLLHEITIPGGNNIYPPDQQIFITDLEIGYEKDTLQLYEGSQQVYTYDLSLEAFNNRSNLYKLLAHFNPDVRPSLSIFLKMIDDRYQLKYPGNGQEVYCWPRVSYADTIVLRRKTWQIRTTVIPIPQKDESGLDYFTRLNSWRSEHGLPERIFLFLRKRSKRQDKKAGLDDDYKPQLISFLQPLMIELLKKLITRAGEYIYFEEVLPEPSGTVKEYLLQWYKY